MRVFVAGGTGVLGRRVVPLLVEAGHELTVNTRDPRATERVRELGAAPLTVDLFNTDAVAEAVAGHDAVINIATSIPVGSRAGLKSAWKTNDRLRSEASANLASAIAESAGRYVGESVTFAYADGGDRWIDESHSYKAVGLVASLTDSEAAARSVTEAGGIGSTLRFALFSASDSGHHADFQKYARLGVFPIPGDPDAYISTIDVDDAARAVVAALEVPPGVYNIAEADPQTRRMHGEALAQALGKKRLRHMPAAVMRLASEGADGLTRGHRISSRTFAEATGWEPRVAPRLGVTT